MNLLFQFICIVTTQPTEPTPNMCKARPTTNNGEDISSSNTEVGLINLSAEGWSLNKPHHWTEIVSSLLFIILLLFGAYKLRKRCIKKRERNSNSNEPGNNPYYNLNILPNQPPAQAHNYQQAEHHPHNPTYETVQPKYNPPQPEAKQEPMPYNIMAMLAQNKNDTNTQSDHKDTKEVHINPMSLKTMPQANCSGNI